MHLFQVLISGARVAIDVDDLRKNTNYSGETYKEKLHGVLKKEILADLGMPK